jgi:hypothetical protein
VREEVLQQLAVGQGRAVAAQHQAPQVLAEGVGRAGRHVASSVRGGMPPVQFIPGRGAFSSVFLVYPAHSAGELLYKA